MATKSNEDVYDDNVEIVRSPGDLPYVYVPFSSYRAAREKHPDDKLYIYEGLAPGFKIIAHPVVLNKPIIDKTQPGWFKMEVTHDL